MSSFSVQPKLNNGQIQHVKDILKTMLSEQSEHVYSKFSEAYIKVNLHQFLVIFASFNFHFIDVVPTGCCGVDGGCGGVFQFAPHDNTCRNRILR